MRGRAGHSRATDALSRRTARSRAGVRRYADAGAPPIIRPIQRGAGLIGYTTMKLSRFGIEILGRVCALISSLSPMIPLRRSRYAVTAYLLRLNGIIGESDEINAQTLPRISMPNRDNFIVVYPIKPAPR